MHSAAGLAKVNSEFLAVGSFAVAHRFVELSAPSGAEILAALPELSENGYELEAVKTKTKKTLRIKVTEKETSAARHIEVPDELFAPSPSYESLRARTRR